MNAANADLNMRTGIESCRYAISGVSDRPRAGTASRWDSSTNMILESGLGTLHANEAAQKAGLCWCMYINASLLNNWPALSRFNRPRSWIHHIMPFENVLCFESFSSLQDYQEFISNYSICQRCSYTSGIDVYITGFTELYVVICDTSQCSRSSGDEKVARNRETIYVLNYNWPI